MNVVVVNKRLYTPERGDTAIYVGRPSRWGNPYLIGRDGNREEVIAKYEAWIEERPDLVQQLAELHPTVLVCWCSPLRCHADVLAQLLSKPKAVA